MKSISVNVTDKSIQDGYHLTEGNKSVVKIGSEGIESLSVLKDVVLPTCVEKFGYKLLVKELKAKGFVQISSPVFDFVLVGRNEGKVYAIDIKQGCFVKGDFENTYVGSMDIREV